MVQCLCFLLLATLHDSLSLSIVKKPPTACVRFKTWLRFLRFAPDGPPTNRRPASPARDPKVLALVRTSKLADSGRELCKDRGEGCFKRDGAGQDRGEEEGRVWRLLDTYRIRTIRRLHTGAIEQEANLGEGFPRPLAKGVHQFRKCGGPFDLEEDLVVVVGHFDI